MSGFITAVEFKQSTKYGDTKNFYWVSVNEFRLWRESCSKLSLTSTSNCIDEYMRDQCVNYLLSVVFSVFNSPIGSHLDLNTFLQAGNYFNHRTIELCKSLELTFFKKYIHLWSWPIILNAPCEFYCFLIHFSPMLVLDWRKWFCYPT